MAGMVQATARPRSSPLRGRYHFSNRWLNAAMRCIDGVLKLLMKLQREPRSRPTDITTVRPPRILVANGAHLGDAVLSTSIFTTLRQTFVDCEIGVLVGSWSAPVMRNHPMVARVHVVDHWFLNRASIGIRAKWLHYRRSRATALRELRSSAYDIAIDLYFYFPNSIVLLWKAGIPVRVGYTSAGFGPLLTRPVEWQHLPQSIGVYHRALVMALAPARSTVPALSMRPSLADPGPLPRRLHDRLGSVYVVVHPGTGSKMKEWPAGRWRLVVQQLLARGRTIAFTGSGQRESEIVAQVMTGRADEVNLCDQLSWSEFVSVIAHAALFIGVDSVGAHIASAFGVRSVIITAATNHPALWQPMSDDSITMSAPVACAPCYLSRGCTAMTCIRTVDSASVVSAAEALLPAELPVNADNL